MPIYEFYCSDCHTVFNFLARSLGVKRIPACPRCGRADLDRKISRFAISKGRRQSDEKTDDLPADFDEAKMERLMAEMERESAGVDEDDPRQMARLLHKLHDATGMPIGEGMAEAMGRMEAGEDPEKIEEEMGDLLDQDEPLTGEEAGGSLRRLSKRLRPPQVDDTLYDL